MPRLYGIIGHPVMHSLSPAMQNAAFKALRLDAEYTIFDVEPDGLEAFLNGAAVKKMSGLNVTIPHKIKAGEYIKRKGALDANAEKLGAVNTIKIEGGKLFGFNTDGPGFYRSLIEDLKFEPEGRPLFILGAGGAARAIVMYLGSSPKEIYAFDLDTAMAEGLKEHYEKHYGDGRLKVVKPAEIGEVLKKCDLLVNATPIGMKESDGLPLDKGFLHSRLYIYDLVYNRPVTELVKTANRMKLHAVTGAGMLLYQGAISFEIWTGEKAPVGVMKKALKEALKNG
jgi:shikimate dehydrogenase